MQFNLKREVWTNTFLATHLIWVTGAHLIAFSCDPEPADSGLEFRKDYNNIVGILLLPD